MSVDHERAGLRAGTPRGYNTHVTECQSIMSALACALCTTACLITWQARCQSIMSALACALRR